MKVYEYVENITLEYMDCPNQKWISVFASDVIDVRYNSDAEMEIIQVYENRLYKFSLPYGRILEYDITAQYCVVESNGISKLLPYNNVKIQKAIRKNAKIKNEPFEERRFPKSPLQLVPIQQLDQKKIVKEIP